MSAERNLWKYLNNKMGVSWDAQRHEDKFTTGIPDVSYAIDGVSGWIELKCLEAWPLNNIAVKVPHFSPDQKLWLFMRGRYGHAFFFLKVDKEYLLIDGRDAMKVGKLKKAELIQLSLLYSKGFDKDGFTTAISQPYKWREIENLEIEK